MSTAFLELEESTASWWIPHAPGFVASLTMIGLLICSSVASADNVIDRLNRVLQTLPQQTTKPATPSDEVAKPTSSDDHVDSAVTTVMMSTSTASPELVGVKLGVSGVDDVKAALKKISPPLAITESSHHLMLQTKAGLQDVPQSEWVKAVNAASGCRGRNCSKTIFVYFSSPPADAKAFFVALMEDYAQQDATSFENMRAALEKKFGVAYASTENTALTYSLNWAWGPSGSAVTLTKGHPCTAPTATAVGGQDSVGHGPFIAREKVLLGAGCAAVVQANLSGANGIVTHITVTAIDAFHFDQSSRQTEAWLKDYGARSEQQARDEAAQKEAPSF